jgi:hypothetical protein
MNQITATHFSSSNCPPKIEFNLTIMEAFSVALIVGYPIQYCQSSIIFGASRPILLSGNYFKAMSGPPFNFGCGQPA